MRPGMIMEFALLLKSGKHAGMLVVRDPVSWSPKALKKSRGYTVMAPGMLRKRSSKKLLRSEVDDFPTDSHTSMWVVPKAGANEAKSRSPKTQYVGGLQAATSRQGTLQGAREARQIFDGVKEHANRRGITTHIKVGAYSPDGSGKIPMGDRSLKRMYKKAGFKTNRTAKKQYKQRVSNVQSESVAARLVRKYQPLVLHPSKE